MPCDNSDDIVIFLHRLAPDLSLRLETTPKRLLSLTEGRWWWLHVWVGACRRGMGASQRWCSLCACMCVLGGRYKVGLPWGGWPAPSFLTRDGTGIHRAYGLYQGSSGSPDDLMPSTVSLLGLFCPFHKQRALKSLEDRRRTPVPSLWACGKFHHSLEVQE